MKVPSNVVWQLTKKYSSFLVKDRQNGAQFSRDPLNLTGLHNAQDSGISNQRSIGVQLVNTKTKKKGVRANFEVLKNHKNHNMQKVKKANTQSKAGYSVDRVSRITRAAKVIKGFTHITEKTRKTALRRLMKLQVAARPQIKGAVAKKAEEKK